MRANIVRVLCCDLGHEPIHRFFWPIVLGTTINPSAAIAQIPHSQKIPMSVARNRSWDSEGWLIITESGILFNEDDKELFSAISITCRRQNERTSYASSSFLYNMYLISASCVLLSVERLSGLNATHAVTEE